MAITQLPQELHASDPLACSICRVKLLLDKATAGFLDANNYQAFACVSHFSEVGLLIVGWADFMTNERRRHLRQKQEMEALGVSGNAWLNS